MKIATTTGDFGFYCNTDEERIRELHKAGFRYIDLSMYSFTPNCDYMQDNWREAVHRIKNLADELGMKFVQAHSQGGNPLSEDVAKAKAESVLREIYGNDFEDGYTFYAYGAGFGKSAVFVTFRRYLHGVATVDHLSVSFLGDQVSSIDARQKDYFGGNSKNITREMVDRAIESMRVYLGVESLSREACMLMVNEDGRYLLRCIYDQEYFIEVK